MPLGGRWRGGGRSVDHFEFETKRDFSVSLHFCIPTSRPRPPRKGFEPDREKEGEGRKEGRKEGKRRRGHLDRFFRASAIRLWWSVQGAHARARPPRYCRRPICRRRGRPVDVPPKAILPHCVLNCSCAPGAGYMKV